MIAALICIISVAAFLQFFVSYCRSIIAASRRVELSEHVREITGIAGRVVPAEDFERHLQLVHLCRESADDGREIRAVETYYTLLRVVRYAARLLMPAGVAWVEREREGCSYFAVVALDRRISSASGQSTRETSGRL
jgi:hypothetical protein